MTNSSGGNHALPFGKHRGQPLSVVPTDYLEWVRHECKLSSGLRSAVVEELRSRGVNVPPPEPVRRPDPCHRCGSGDWFCFWMEDAGGGRRIRAECSHCGRFLTFLPEVPEYVRQADAGGRPTDLMDLLLDLDELGVEPRSDGRSVYFSAEDERKLPPEVRDLARQCSHRLARLLGVRP